ncbi:hypothetical protein HPB52_018491 [Rhipicephalus sanguineus]|uniref:Uncharacterized protein n=1 Tax=Rhipicephalus sanguineus TaxID=34632 RepID=A0A9D4PX03_RHISA|nr:hypothetical protein HPB52_018491 [Rhipicephalus sanguineus]
MAATALRGYDPTTLAWKEVSASTSEGSVPPTDIVDEGLFTVSALRKHRQQSKATTGSATDKASAKIPPKKNTSRACKARCRRSQQPGKHHGGRGSPQQRSTPKTSDVTPEGRLPGAPYQAPKNTVAGRTNQQAPPPPKTPHTSQKTSSKTLEPSAPRAPSWGFSTPDRCWRSQAADQGDILSASLVSRDCESGSGPEREKFDKAMTLQLPTVYSEVRGLKEFRSRLVQVASLVLELDSGPKLAVEGRTSCVAVPCRKRSRTTLQVEPRSSHSSCASKQPTASSVELQSAGWRVTPASVTSSASPPHQTSAHKVIAANDTTGDSTFMSVRVGR